MGIGDTGPDALLDVKGSAAQVAIFDSSATGGAYVQFSESETARGYLGAGAGVFTGALASSLGIRAQGALHFGSGGDKIRSR